MGTPSHKADAFVGPMRIGAPRSIDLRREVERLQDRVREWLRAPGTMPWHVFLPPEFPEREIVDWRGPGGEMGRDPLSDLPEAARHAPLRVWTPAVETLLTVAQWPGRGRGRLAEALPYLMEDQLLMDPDSLAFSYKESNDGIFVAVTAKERLSAWRAVFDRERLSASFCPVTLALPWRPGTWSCRFADGQWAVRTGPYSGFGAAGGLKHPPAALVQALEEAQKHNTKPELLTLFNGDEALRQMLADGLAVPVAADRESIGDSEPPVFRLGETGGTVTAAGVTALRALRPTLLVLGIWFLLGFAHTAFEWARLSHQESRVRNEMVSVFTASFPNAPVLDPVTQMRQGVDKLSGQIGGGGDSFLSIMTLASPALAHLAPGALTRIEFRAGRVRCAVKLGNFDALTVLKGHLVRAGLMVTVSHIMSHHGGVQAEVTMTRRTS